MLGLYFFSNSQLQLLSAISLLLCASQVYYVAIILFKYIRKNYLEIFTEIFFLIYIATIATLPIIIIINRQYGIVDISNYVVFVNILIPILLFTSLGVFFKGRSFLYVLLPVLMSLTHPIFSTSNYKLYVVFYCIFIAFGILRNTKLISNALIEYKTIITPLSIREGLDNLHTGIMFFETDGYIQLCNKKMKEIMYRLYKKEYKNAHSFWNALKHDNLYNIERFTVAEDIVIRTSSDTLYFSQKKFTIGKKIYVELIASDVSSIDKDILELERKNQELVKQEKKIYTFTDTIKKLKKEQEIAELQYHVHDIMAQQLTAIQRMLQSNESGSYNSVIPILQDMVKNIKTSYSPTLHQSFCELQEYFKNLGIEIQECGIFPENSNHSQLFLSIIREATTNAIRHANANIIYVSISNDNRAWNIKITNNGKAPQRTITEGWGISGIRKRVEKVDGKVSIETSPIFTLTIQVNEVNDIELPLN